MLGYNHTNRIKRLPSGEEMAVGPDDRPAQIFTAAAATPPPHLAGRDRELSNLNGSVWDMMGRTGVK